MMYHGNPVEGNDPLLHVLEQSVYNLKIRTGNLNNGIIRAEGLIPRRLRRGMLIIFPAEISVQRHCFIMPVRNGR